MSTIVRLLQECITLWRVWVPLIALSIGLPLLGIALPLLEKTFIDRVLIGRNVNELFPLLSAYAAVWAGMTFAHLAVTPLRTTMDEQLSLRLRGGILSQSASLSVDYARREASGKTLSLLLSDVPIMASLPSSTALSAISTSILLVGGLAVMVRMNWQLAFAAGVFPAIVVLLLRKVTRPLRTASQQIQEEIATVTSASTEYLSGLREIVVFGQASRVTTGLRSRLAGVARLRVRLSAMETAIASGQSIFSLVANVTLLTVGGYLTLRGQSTVGGLVAMRALLNMVFQPATQLGGLVSSAQKAIASGERVYAFLDRAPLVAEAERPAELRAVQGEVRFEGVTFGYDPDCPVVKEISFATAPGETVALVGPSGAGKTTLASLMLRFYDPQSGSVSIDGIDLRHVKLADLRAHVGAVFQDTFLFSGSIRENIAFGCPQAAESAIEAAAQSAQAWDFICALPEGLSTQVGERGVRLSEGQKQRIAIARTILQDPAVVILDEPTSSLDALSEAGVEVALRNLFASRTSFIIAHRLATARRADVILVMDQGRIVQRGTHAELLEQRGLYRSLVEAQAGAGPAVHALEWRTV